MRARSIAITTVVCALAACTAPTRPPEGGRPAPLGAVLTLDTADGALIVGPSGSAVSEVGRTVASPDGARLYTTTSVGTTATRVGSWDSTTGELLGSRTIEGPYDVRVASLSGTRVALMRTQPRDLDPTVVLPRARTTIVVADIPGQEAPRVHRLEGNFEPEAFSVDDGRLFLIQYLPALAPSSYRVTVLDLESGAVRPVRGRFRSPPERMPGVRLAQVFDPVSEQLYTLYTNRPAAHFHDHWQEATYGDREVSFVHVLNLRSGWAYCAGLPRTLWGQPVAAQAMAPSPDGRSLFIVDSRRQLVAEMDTRTLTITRTERIDLGDPVRGRTSAHVSPDGVVLWIGVADAVSRIDVATFDVLGRSRFAGPVRSFASSADGTRLFIALRDAVSVVDPTTGRTLAAPSFPRIESILHVATP
jgi:DNA-binding beta-propeller fold protein YncE